MRWRRLLVVGSVLVVVVLATASAGRPVYVHPRSDSASAADPADAVVALGGLSYSAVYAEQLRRDGVAKQLVVSNPYPPGEPVMARLCPQPPLPDITCFDPDPATTRGEAEEIGRLAKANGWDDVIVVAPTWHISRARLIVSRCFTGRLRMLDPGIPARRYDWPAIYLYQTAGFVKAAVLRGC